MKQQTTVLRRLTRRRGDEAGAALVLVVGSMLVIMMLALTALAYAIESQGFARTTQDYTGAMAAAQSGVEDYIGRLNRADDYDLALDCTNAALRGPIAPTSPYAAGTCGYTGTSAAGWLPVIAGETDPEAASFHYEVVSRDDAQQTLTLRSTGRVEGEYRTIEAILAKGGSTDYVYYTDFESADPSNVQAYTASEIAGMTSAEKDACGITGYTPALYWYEGRGTYGCSEITFIGEDVLKGPVFSNDAVKSDGATFTDGFSSANPGCASVTSAVGTWNNCLRSGSTADFNGHQPTPEDALYLDDTSTAFASYPGCHYYGSTRVIFNGNGTMTVWNKRSSNGNTAPVGIGSAGHAAPTCGNLDALDTTGAVVPVPDGMVVYAGPAPASVARRQCSAGNLGGSGSSALPVGTYNATSTPAPAYGVTYTYTADLNMAETTKACAEGNLYAQGTVKGRVTLAAAQSIVVTGDLVLAGGKNGPDLLGLVATNAVEVFNPRLATFNVQKRYPSCSSTSPGGGATQSYQYCATSTSGAKVAGWPMRYKDTDANANVPARGIQIAGSIQTLLHSFFVQKYADTDNMLGNEQELYVFGSIAQRWRGIVGQTEWNGYGTVVALRGYVKNYTYDLRLRLSSPPYFPRWVNAQWLLRYSGEVDTPSAVKTP